MVAVVWRDVCVASTRDRHECAHVWRRHQVLGIDIFEDLLDSALAQGVANQMSKLEAFERTLGAAIDLAQTTFLQVTLGQMTLTH